MSVAPAESFQPGVHEFPAETPPVARDAVLLVEDDAPVAALVTHILSRLGYRVLHARDGAECLRLFAANSAAVALAFMDCTLPDAHGGALSQKLRATRPGLPVLLTSGREQPGLLKLLAVEGPTAILPKPYLPGAVTQHFKVLLGSETCGRR